MKTNMTQQECIIIVKDRIQQNTIYSNFRDENEQLELATLIVNTLIHKGVIKTSNDEGNVIETKAKKK